MRLRPSLWWLLLAGLAAPPSLVDRRRPSPLHHAEWLDAGGVTVRAVRAGAGDTTILLLHGFGESLATWREVFDPLAERHRVVAIDLPGLGASAKPDVSYSLPAMTERLSRFVDRWTTGPLVVVGQSMGGELAASPAPRRPDRVKLLVLIAPAGYRVGRWGILDRSEEHTA